MQRLRSSAKSFCIGAALAAVLMLAINGASVWPPSVRAEIRQEPPAVEPFLSGGARSEIVLKEVLGVLKTIDGRLERLERAVQNAAQNDAAAAHADPAPAVGAATP